MSVDVATETVVAMLLVSIRLVAWLVVAPPFSHRGIPVTVKAMLAFALALVVLPGVESVPDLDAAALSVAAAQQVVIGSGLGFLCMLVFAAVQAAGDLIDLFGGFTLAFAFDPLMQTGSATFGRTYQLTAMALLFASDGHLLLVRGLLRTYDVLPLGGSLDLALVSSLLTDGLTQMFVAALQIAGPLIAVLFLTDVGLGLLTRVAPALNAFALGFPLKILMTLTLIGVAVAVLPRAVGALAEDAVRLVVGGAGG